jgi:hypothetical protein
MDKITDLFQDNDEKMNLVLKRFIELEERIDNMEQRAKPKQRRKKRRG